MKIILQKENSSNNKFNKHFFPIFFMAGDYVIENLYEPGYNSFSPSPESPYLNKQNLIPAGQMGMTVDPRTADQLGQLSHALNTGAVPIELGTLDPQTFDTIPKQHFEEMRRKAKLAEAKVSLHAPVQGTDPAGFGQQGWEEQNRELVERQLKDVVDKAAIIDKKGNLPITIHGSNTSGSTFKMVDGKKEYDMLVGVDKSSGQMVPIKETVQFSPGGNLDIGDKMDPMTALRSHNSTQWRKEVDGVLFEKESAERILAEAYPVGKDIYTTMKLRPDEAHKIFTKLPTPQKEIVSSLRTADAHIHQAEINVTSLFDKAYQYGGRNKEEKERRQRELKQLAQEYDKQIHGGYTSKDYEEIMKRARKAGRILESDREKFEKIEISRSNLVGQSQAIHNFAEQLRRYNPEMITPMENFAIDKGSETFANVALHSYKKYGEGAPIVSIENLYQGMGFSQGEDLKNLVEKSQETFVNKLVEKENISKSKAQQIAEKLIGVTFDVGHLNISKSKGFTDEDLKKEAEQIAKHVKHVHLTDNFGYSDTHLPIGMGNVPVKELLEALGEKGERARKINEVGGWFQFFKTNPFPQLLEAAGSQIYSSGSGPYWSQAGGFQQSYMEGYGQMLPQTNYQLFGAGFSQLPQSLGGQVGQSGGGRMGGGGF